MYNYENEKPNLFTEDGQLLFIEIRDRVKGLIKLAGAVNMEKAIQGSSGSSWTMLACVDRMVEIGELKELTTDNAGWAQDRVFVARSRH